MNDPDGFAAPAGLAPLPRSDYASFGQRLAAWVLDSVILIPIVVLPAALLGEWFAWIAADLYAIGFIAFGATPGMRIVKIHVIDGHFGKPGWLRSLKRWLIPGLTANLVVFGVVITDPDEEIADWLFWATTLTGIVGLVDILWILWDERRRALHDMLAVTFVLNDAVVAPVAGGADSVAETSDAMKRSE